MPVIVRCVCGKVLDLLKESTLTMNYLYDIVKHYEGHCPACKRVLKTEPVNVEVKPNPGCKKRLVGDWKHDYHLRRLKG